MVCPFSLRTSQRMRIIWLILSSFNITSLRRICLVRGIDVFEWETYWFSPGLYTLLFVISVYVLVWCNKPIKWFLLVTSVTMYAIATVDIVYTMWLLFRTVFGKMVFQFWHLYPKYNLFVTNTWVFPAILLRWFFFWNLETWILNRCVAHVLLLYRCVAVWGNNWWLMGLGLLGLTSVTGA
jgi:hypothetical protein